jgi:L-threonylcarbamoyladenylate synthase
MLKAPLLRRIRWHLRHGGLIAYATESCFGIGCDPRNARAVGRVLKLKGRPKSKGLILIAARFDQLAAYVAPLSERDRAQVFQWWPGPHTWLLPPSAKATSTLRGAHSSIAVRVTAHPDAALLCARLKSALVSTSANRSGRRPIRTLRECRRQFGGRLLLVPGQIGKRSRPSVIQDLKSGRIVR